MPKKVLVKYGETALLTTVSEIENLNGLIPAAYFTILKTIEAQLVAENITVNLDNSAVLQYETIA